MSTNSFSYFVEKGIKSGKNKLPLDKTAKIILGIDPGTLVMGFGVIKVTSKGVTLIVMDVLKISSKLDAYERLKIIHTKIQELLIEYSPHEFAIEAPFFGKKMQCHTKQQRIQ